MEERTLPPENELFLSQQIVTYLGNKRALLPFIENALGQVKRELGSAQLSIGDIFSGSGIVSRFFKRHARYLLANDLEGYSRTLNRCYLSNSADRREQDLKEAYAYLQKELQRHGLEEGFISRLYAPKDEQGILKGERVFYTPRNARFLDTARSLMETLPEDIKPFFLAPLLSEASKKANTAGVFKGFYKDGFTGKGQYGGKGSDALSRIKADILLLYPLFSRFDCGLDIAQADACALAHKMPELDLVYLDPPYNQHPYGSNYFMLNVINDYREPEALSPVSGIPKAWNRSVFNQAKRAEAALAELCEELPARYLLISFNSEGFIGKPAMQAMLSKNGEVTVFETQYNTYRGSRNLKNRSIHTKEYLFLVKKR